MTQRTILPLLATLLFIPFFVLDSHPLVKGQSQPPATPTPRPSPTPTESWWQKLLRITGLSANPGAQRSPSNAATAAGEIWIKNLVRSNAGIKLAGGTRIAIGAYRSPIFLARDESILALKETLLVRIPVSGGTEQEIPNKAGIFKLVGINQDDPDKILVIMKNADQTSIGLLSLNDNSVSVIAYETDTTEGHTMFARILGSDRMYCDAELYLESQCNKDEKGECIRDAHNQIKVWTDVMIKHAYRSALNISNCKGTNCGQPSLSLDGNTVVYIREAH